MGDWEALEILTVANTEYEKWLEHFRGELFLH
jgi:hypothetical protein